MAGFLAELKRWHVSTKRKSCGRANKDTSLRRLKSQAQTLRQFLRSIGVLAAFCATDAAAITPENLLRYSRSSAADPVLQPAARALDEALLLESINAALNVTNSALKIDPRNAPAPYRRGVIQSRIGNAVARKADMTPPKPGRASQLDSRCSGSARKIVLVGLHGNFCA